MASRTLTLGLDVGSSAVKAALVDVEMGVVAACSEPVALTSRHPGWAEADPSAWWRSVGPLVAELTELAGVSSSEIAAVGCSGMVPAVICLDQDRRPLGPAILQNDARATDEIVELQDELQSVDLLQRTGSVLSQQSVAPTVRWLQRHQPQVWANTRHVVGSYDWLAISLGARVHVEENWGLESGLFDLDGEPVQEVWQAAGLRADQVPDSLLPGSVGGELTPGASAATGLRAGTPIVVGGADHVLSAYGAGLDRPGMCLIKLGGAGDILAVSQRPIADRRIYLDAHPIEGLWLPNGCMATSGSLVRWFQSLTGGPDLMVLDKEAETQTPATLMCLPYFLGEKSPHHDPNLRGAFVGMHLGTTRGELHRSILEAVAYGFRQHTEILAELGLDLDEVRVTNGGSRSVLWKQILADVLQRPLTPVVDHPGASLGAAVAAGIGIGAVKSWATNEALVRLGPPINPHPAHSDPYQKGFQMYVDLERALRPISHTLAHRSSW